MKTKEQTEQMIKLVEKAMLNLDEAPISIYPTEILEEFEFGNKLGSIPKAYDELLMFRKALNWVLGGK